MSYVVDHTFQFELKAGKCSPLLSWMEVGGFSSSRDKLNVYE